MKILVLGGSGMLGHQLCRDLRNKHDVWLTLRRPINDYSRFKFFHSDNVIHNFDATSASDLARALVTAQPEVVINCIGIIKQLKEAHSPEMCLKINSLLPHQLAKLCANENIRLIHLSTDCVFSGRKGDYSEVDVSDAEDLYGRTKFLGELQNLPNCLTLRTSIIGRELQSKSGLVEWFLSRRSCAVQGYTRAIFSGFTTIAFARVLDTIILRHGDISGLWHVSSDAVSKYDLLCLLQKAFNWAGTIIADGTFICDRSLDSSRFRQKTLFQPPSWADMVSELARSEV